MIIYLKSNLKYFSIFFFSLFILISCTGEKSQTGTTDSSKDADTKKEFSFNRDYHFGNGTIRRNVLESYLSRAITMAEFCTGGYFLVDGPYSYKQDDIRMLQNIGAKFIGRSIYLWGGENKVNDPRFWEDAKQVIDRMHQKANQLIFQAAIFEIITTKVNQVKVPAWAFREFNQPIKNRNFRYKAMLNKDGKLVNHWSEGASVPDISRLETQMWFFYLARKYIDIGVEAIHFGQVELMAMEDKNFEYKNWENLLSRVRNYAKEYARRKMILCDGHLPGGGIVVDGKLLFDFHSFPSRPKAIATAPQKTILEKGYLDAFYGRSKGGITPSGWTCKHLPYLVELDNFGISDHPGEYRSSDYFVWGYDEISWFSLQSKAYRNKWLRYAWNWIRTTDAYGFLEMPGSRVITTGASHRKERRYRANTRSSTCPLGYGQEKTIKNIWLNNK